MLSPEIALELRSSRPVASPELRARVLDAASRERARTRPFRMPSLRLLAAAGTAAVVALGVGIAVVHGLTQDQARPRVAVQDHGAAGTRTPLAPVAGARSARRLSADEFLPATPSRLQQYGASLRLQVDDRERLSTATKRAMRVARLLGGYVAAVEYSAPRNRRGAAALVIRVPVDRVQDAVAEYSELGTILAQRVHILDVTKAVQEQAREIARLRETIARLRAGGVTPDERYRLRALEARLDFLTKRNVATVRRAELARISLTLLTKPRTEAAPAGRFERTLRDAGGVLRREAELLLYALIVAGPLLLLGGAALATARAVQRRRDAQLLERS